MNITHPFVSAKGDGPDSTLVRPQSGWNANHTFTISQANRYVGRDKTGAGNAQELPIVPSTAADDGTMWTAAKVQEMINAAISGVTGGILPMPLGMIVGSINGTMPGFLPLNGQTFGKATSTAFYKSDAYQNLFNLLWPLSTVVMPGGKGASANADWTANKVLTLPQSAGCVMGAQGFGLTNAEFFTIVGGDTQAIAEANLPAHAHTIGPDPSANPYQMGMNGGGGINGVGNVLQATGYNLTTTNTAGSGTPLPVIQRTMLMQVFWIKY